MMNAGRTVQGDKLVEFETVIIREQDGRLAYEAHPSGQQSAVFLSQRVGDREVVFENLQHDFPQRVGYKRDGDSLLGGLKGPETDRRGGLSFRIGGLRAVGISEVMKPDDQSATFSVALHSSLKSKQEKGRKENLVLK